MVAHVYGKHPPFFVQALDEWRVKRRYVKRMTDGEGEMVRSEVAVVR